MTDTIVVRSEKGFYIGDVCYALNDSIYYGIWDKKYHFGDGKIDVPEQNVSFAVGSTAYGDGCYAGSNEERFPVDAGNIGVVPLEIAIKRKEKDLGRLGYIVKDVDRAEYTNVGGEMTISLFKGDDLVEEFDISTR